MNRRESFALAHFDPRVCLSHWTAFDHQVRLPWWLAAITYPIVMGTRLIVWGGSIPLVALRRGVGAWTSQIDHDAEAAAARRGILVLRTFGDDGFEVLAHDRRPGQMMRQIRTLEEIVVAAASSTDLSVYGFRDHDLASYPKGIRQLHVENDSWERQFDVLLPTASAIVVMPTPGAPMGPGLRRELETIREHGLTSRVVVVGPPDIDPETRRGLHDVYELLGWPRPRASYLSAHEGPDGRIAIVPSIGRADRYPAERYQAAIDVALEEILARHR